MTCNKTTSNPRSDLRNDEALKILVRSIKQNHSRSLYDYEVIFRSRIVVLKQQNRNDKKKLGEGKMEKTWREEGP